MKLVHFLSDCDIFTAGGRKMRKGSVIALVFSIVLLVVGLALTVTGAWMSAPHSAVYHYGHGVFAYSMRYAIASPSAGSAYTSFGHLFFDAGLVLMVIFAVLQVNGHKEEKIISDKEKKADFISMKKAKEEAVEATVHTEPAESKESEESTENK